MARKERISYEEYKSKPRKKNDESLVIFVSAFFIMLLLFLAVAKHLSPDVDVSINNVNRFEGEETSSAIDDRLKNIQAADKTAEKQDDMFDYTLEERVKLPVKKPEETKKEAPKLLETKDEIAKRKEEEKKIETLKQQGIKPPEKPAVQPTAPTPQQTAKVIVGRYTTEDQAQMAKSIILDSGLNVTPFVRNVNGVYTIQVGSFSTRENAQVLVNELLKNNYPAKIILE